MGKDARIKKFRRDIRRLSSLDTDIANPRGLSPRSIRRSRLMGDTGSFSVYEVSEAFMRVHGITQCATKDAVQWAAAHRRAGIDWRNLRAAVVSADVSG